MNRKLEELLRNEVKNVMYNNSVAIKPVIETFIKTTLATTKLSKNEVKKIVYKIKDLDHEVNNFIREFYEETGK